MTLKDSPLRDGQKASTGEDEKQKGTDIVWKTPYAEMGRETVDEEKQSVREKLIELLNGEWKTFGEEDDTITVEKCWHED